MKKIFIESIQSLFIKLLFIFCPMSIILMTLLLYGITYSKVYFLLLLFVPIQIASGIYLYKRIKKRTGLLFTSNGVFQNDIKKFDYEEIKEFKKVNIYEYNIILNNELIYRLFMTKEQYLYIKENFDI